MTYNASIGQNSKSVNNIDANWQTQAQSYIEKSEYFFKEITENNKRFTVSKKQRTGFIIDDNGFTASPIKYADNSNKDWKVSMQLKYIGKGAANTFNTSYRSNIQSNENNLSVVYNDFSIDYLNNENGLRQNFVINKKPVGDQDLSIKIKIAGDLKAYVGNNAVQFKNKKGITQMFYRDLKVWDANNKPLDALMQMENNNELVISVDDSKATYPITVDPINQTPEWTTSADGILPNLVGQLAVDAAYGFTVAGLGDVNADGFADVAVGSPTMVDIISGSGTFANVGAVFVYFGSANGLPTTPSAKLQPNTVVAGALFGYSVAGGDVNNDGKADVIVGAPLDNVSIAIGGNKTATGKVGKAYVFSGANLSSPSPTPLLVLQLDGSGILENGVNLSVNALFGFSVAVTEDLNGDGKKDMIVGAPTYAGVTTGLLGNHIADVQSGGAFVFLTNSSNNTTTLTSLTPIKSGLLELGILESNISGLLFGYSVDGLGDYNGDGQPDVVATAPAGINASSISALLKGKVLQGSALVYYGNGAGVNVQAGAKLTAVPGGLLSNLVGSVANIANLFGVSVKGVKNANGVRNGNVLVGAPLGGALVSVLNLQLKTGTVNVFKKQFGASGYVTPDQILTSPRNSNNILQIIQSNLLFGYSLDNVFDVNCDGISDIVVGEPISSGVQLLNANVAGGAAYVYLGTATGSYLTAPSWTLTAYEDAFLGVNATSLIGYSVAGAGKVRGAASNNRVLVGSPSRTLDFGSGLLNLGNTVSTLFSLVAGNNGVGKAFLFDTKQCVALDLTKTDLTCNGNSTGTITATFNDGTGPYMIKIDNGNFATATSPTTFTGLSAGTHTVTVRDANGSEKSVTITVNEPAVITATTTQVNPLCPGQSNGSFTINASGGTGTLTYSKDGGTTYQSSNSFTGLGAGTYDWSVKDANGCLKTGSVTLTDPTVITATATKTDPTYFGATNGSFAINASGGTGTLTYSKDGGTTYQSSNNFTGLTCGTYNWVVKDANGCTKNGSTTLVCPPDITVTATPTNPNCNGSATGSLTLTAGGGTPPFTYSKDGGTTFQSSNTFTGLTAGTYNWVVKDASGYTKSGTTTLTNPPAITATSTPTNPLCFGGTGSFAITASGGTGTLTYSKDGGGTYQASNSFTGLAGGTYNWTVKDANGCIKTGTTTITIPPAITASASKTDPTYFGATNGSFNITASGGTGTLTYSKDGGATYQVSNSFTGLACGTYNWAVKDANGCIKTGTVNLACAPDITVTPSQTNPNCNGSATGSFTLNASGGTGTLTYSKDGGTTFQSSNTFTGLTAGTYNWVVKDANGYTKSGSITLTNPPAITASATPTSPLCFGGTGSFVINTSGGTSTLTYSKDGGATYQSSNSFSELAGGTYNWAVKDANGCIKTGTTTITVPPAITASATSVNPTISGGTNGSLTITASGGTGTLMYSKDGGATYQTSNVFTGLTCITYNWVVKDANGCTKSGSTTLTCPNDITVTPNQTNPNCNGSATGSFTLNASGGAGTLMYSKDGGTTFQSSNTFTGLTGGTYNWVVKDANGNTKTGTITLTNPPVITASATPTSPLCNNGTGSFSITASGGTGALTYSKDGGVTFQSSNTFSNIATGTYNWVVKDANGCTKSGTTIITNPSAITASATFTNPSASGATDGSLTITASGGTGTLMYSKDGGVAYQSSNIFTGLTCTTYNWVVKDANGCTKSGSTTLVCPPPPTGNHIFPTSTSCATFKSGAQPLTQLCYAAKSGKVTNATPGVFFYFSYITAPSPSFTIDIVQNNACGFNNFAIQQGTQIYLYDMNCSNTIAGTQPSTGQGRIVVTNAVIGAQYIISVKYDTKSVVGSTYTGTPPLCQYTFESKIGGVTVNSTVGKINFASNNCTAARPIPTEEIETTQQFDVKLSPNPAASIFRLNINSSANDNIQIRVMDVAGRVIFHTTTASHSLQFGNEFKQGMYFIEVRQGKNKMILKGEKM